MNNKEYVEHLINENKELKRNIRHKENIKMNIYVALGLFAGIGGVIALSAAIPFGVAGLSAAAASIFGYRRAKKNLKSEEESLDSQIEHLEKISKDGINVSPEAERERTKRYNAAKKNIEGKEETVKKHKLRENLVCLTTAFATALGIAVGGVATLACPFMAAFKFATDKAASEDIDDYEKSKAELNNVKNEMKIINKIKSGRKPRKVSRMIVPKKGKEKTYSKEQLRAADKYIEALEKLNNEKQEPKQIVKK